MRFFLLLIIIFNLLIQTSFIQYEKKELMSKQEFYKKIIGNDEIVDLIFKITNNQGYEEEILGLINKESVFNKHAKNYNKFNKSYDRGILQLNNKSFPDLKHFEFFDLNINLLCGITHFKWCLKQSNYSIEKAILIYHIGIGNFYKGYNDKKYVNDVLNYSINLKLMYIDYIFYNKGIIEK